MGEGNIGVGVEWDETQVRQGATVRHQGGRETSRPRRTMTKEDQMKYCKRKKKKENEKNKTKEHNDGALGETESECINKISIAW